MEAAATHSITIFCSRETERRGYNCYQLWDLLHEGAVATFLQPSAAEQIRRSTGLGGTGLEPLSRDQVYEEGLSVCCVSGLEPRSRDRFQDDGISEGSASRQEPRPSESVENDRFGERSAAGLEPRAKERVRTNGFAERDAAGLEPYLHD
jgi:hypothetical protein